VKKEVEREMMWCEKEAFASLGMEEHHQPENVGSLWEPTKARK
jgi:hypothetical protein